jgi:hypothetical protein
VTVPTTIDAAGWLSKHLAGENGDTDLARAMLQTFAETLMSAQAQMLCGAGYREHSDERVTPATDIRPGRGARGSARSTWPSRSSARAPTTRTGCSSPAPGPNKR